MNIRLLANLGSPRHLSLAYHAVDPHWPRSGALGSTGRLRGATTRPRAAGLPRRHLLGGRAWQPSRPRRLDHLRRRLLLRARVRAAGAARARLARDRLRADGERSERPADDVARRGLRGAEAPVDVGRAVGAGRRKAGRSAVTGAPIGCSLRSTTRSWRMSSPARGPRSPTTSAPAPASPTRGAR